MLAADRESAEVFSVRFGVPRETMAKLVAYVEMVREENAAQNLVGQSTVDIFWHRHVHDSAQLVSLAPPRTRSWLDVGSGAGLPGVVTSLLTNAPHVLVEPRRRRAEFLHRAVETLGLDGQVEVLCKKVERVERPAFGVIMARAFAPLTRALAATAHLGDGGTVWLLPKGRTAAREVAEARAEWAGNFKLVTSATDGEATVVKISGLSRRRRA